MVRRPRRVLILACHFAEVLAANADPANAEAQLATMLVISLALEIRIVSSWLKESSFGSFRGITLLDDRGQSTSHDFVPRA
jgi:hypothetical protein